MKRADVLVIQLDACETTCGVCGAETTGLRLAVPVYAGQLLPDTWRGEWAGVDACAACFALQQGLTTPCDFFEVVSDSKGVNNGA